MVSIFGKLSLNPIFDADSESDLQVDSRTLAQILRATVHFLLGSSPKSKTIEVICSFSFGRLLRIHCSSASRRALRKARPSRRVEQSATASCRCAGKCAAVQFARSRGNKKVSRLLTGSWGLYAYVHASALSRFPAS